MSKKTLGRRTNCKNGISSYELARHLGVTQKTAWFMLSRLRLAMQDEDGGKLGGEVEVDETFIGGKARNMHKARRQRVIKGRGPVGKVAVMGLLERHGKDGHSTMRTRVIGGRRKKHVEQRWTLKFGQLAKVESRPRKRSLECHGRDGVIPLS